jgi:2-C-methyl-D-erythritol 2,4-cyclodiphosphate synthase
MELLGLAWDRVRSSGWSLANLDCVVSVEKPAILPHREAIRTALAELLDVSPAAVSVKGKTGEGLGPIGEGLAVEALAICLLERY